MTTITIRFRAKRAAFSGGDGYKVPALTASHVSFSDRSTVAVLLGTARDLPAALRRFGVNLPGVVWADGADCLGNANDPRWSIRPTSALFAEVTLTAELQRTR